jgi:hypothetical protein
MDSGNTAQKKDWQDAPAIAAGMMRHDSRLLLLLTPFLAAVHVTSGLFAANNRWHILAFAFLQCTVELSFLFIIGHAWLLKLKLYHHQASRLTAAVRLFAAGLTLWVIMTLPLLLGSVASNRLAQGLFLILSLPALMIAYRYYFYFLPAISAQGGFQELFSAAGEYVRQDKFAPLRVLLPPIGLMLIWIQLAAIPAPDGRYLTLQVMSALSAVIFWVTATYLGLAYAFLAMPAQSWRNLNLDPYRTARFETLKRQSPQRLAYLLGTPAALRLLLLGSIIWTGNNARLIYMPPAADITLNSIATEDNTVIIELAVSDERHNFRGFNPAQFYLAGERGTVVSDKLSAVILPSNSPVTDSLPHNQPKAILQLSFRTSRSGRALVELEDLYLWYRAVRLYRVDLKKKKIIPVEQYR